MRGSVVLLCASACIFVITHAVEGRCWGDAGHRIVGDIASHYLNPRAAEAVESCLTEADYPTLADAATWADVYARRLPTYAWANPQHYVNVAAKASTYVEVRDCPSGCVVTAIEHFRSAIAEPGDDLAARKRRQEALYFLAHFVGDLHQPLHVAHPDLRGGNSTEISFFGETRRAHWIWDEGILLRGLQRLAGPGSSAARQTWADLAFSLRMEIDPEERARWQKDSNPERWANESLALAKQHAFLKPGEVLGDGYVASNWRIVEKQLQKAGVRLAGLLNEVFR